MDSFLPLLIGNICISLSYMATCTNVRAHKRICVTPIPTSTRTNKSTLDAQSNMARAYSNVSRLTMSVNIVIGLAVSDSQRELTKRGMSLIKKRTDTVEKETVIGGPF